MIAEAEKLECKYCKKEFRRISSLTVHMCESKRRWQQEKDTGVRFGLQAYVKFYETMSAGNKDKSYAGFVSSPYYSAFVKFGQYIVSIQAVNPTAFIEWIIKSNKKLDSWCSDRNYDEYLLQYLRHENPQDALERALKEMEKWAEENNSVFNHFFLFGNENKICQMINNGRISPWVIFNCDSGTAMLGKLNTSQLDIIYSIIDPDFWNRKLETYASDASWVKDILNQAGL